MKLPTKGERVWIVNIGADVNLKFMQDLPRLQRAWIGYPHPVVLLSGQSAGHNAIHSVTLQRHQLATKHSNPEPGLGLVMRQRRGGGEGGRC